MSLERQLARWVDAGLLDRGHAERIAAFERDRAHPLFLIAVAGLAAVAISVGLVAIVAANWDEIPGRAKIGLDLGILSALGVLVWRLPADSKRRFWIRESAIVVFYGAVLASIALVGQVYQLRGGAHQALGMWTLLTALLMAQSRSGFTASCWVLGLHGTYATWLFWAADGPWNAETLALAATYWAPLLSLIVAQVPFVQRHRPALAQGLATFAWVEVVVCGSAGTFAFYGDTASEDYGLFYGGFALSALATAWLWARLEPTEVGRRARWLLLACLVLAHVPWLTSPGDLEIVAALAFIGLWILVAWVAHAAGNGRLLNLATAVVGIRIIVVYFEVFGDLLGTGLGLVTGGVLTLALIAWWVRRRRAFANTMDTGKGSR